MTRVWLLVLAVVIQSLAAVAAEQEGDAKWLAQVLDHYHNFETCYERSMARRNDAYMGEKTRTKALLARLQTNQATDAAILTEKWYRTEYMGSDTPTANTMQALLFLMVVDSTAHIEDSISWCEHHLSDVKGYVHVPWFDRLATAIFF